jgi:cytochrome c551/c552
MLMGASFLSVYFNKKAAHTGNKLYKDFARDVLTKLTFSKHAMVALGVIPLLSILFCYAQLLYQSGSSVLTYVLFSIDLVILALIFIFVFRNSFLHGLTIDSLGKVVKSEPGLESKPEVKDVLALGDELGATAGLSGLWGTLLLFAGAYFFVSGTSLASDPSRWADVRNVFEFLFSWSSLFGFLYLLTAAGAISGSSILFYFFKWQGGIQDMSVEYSSFVKNFAIILTFVSIILLPVLLLLSFIFVPRAALSGSVFIYFVLLLIAVLVACNLLYLMFKNSELSFVTAVFFLVFITFGFGILKDQLLLANALREHTETLIAKSEDYEKEIASKLTTSSGVDAEQIYNTKCIACHKFDIKLVGPPYNETVPTFKGDVNALADFIYNPSTTPKNAGYPPMPNQGLKKKEATAMAQWLINKVAKK